MRLASLLLCLVACGDSDPPLGRVIDFTAPPLPDPAQLGIPANDDGTYTLIAQDGAELRIDPSFRSPQSLPTLCNHWLLACVSPPERTMDDCFRSVPRCSSERSWQNQEVCCPEACRGEYFAKRRAGTSRANAWFEVLTGTSCFPGLAGYHATGVAP